MGRVIWTEPALADVQEIVQFISKDSPRYAQNVASRIAEAPRGLGSHPHSGGRVPEFDRDDIREILVKPYRIIYCVRDSDCYVVAVIHGARDLPTIIYPGRP